MTVAPCMKCGKAKNGECRAEHKGKCETYMSYWHRAREDEVRKYRESELDSLYSDMVDRAYKLAKGKKRVGER